MSRNYSETSGCVLNGGGGDGGDGFMLFGVRVLAEGSFRKSVSLNNLSQYEQLPHEFAAADQEQNAVDHHVHATGYVSDDVAARTRERKRGVPWTEEEHKLFLLGLQKVGKGDWRGISRNFVKTRTPTQVASHAQKYFLRRNNFNRRRRRSSLFDITTDSFMGEEETSTVIHHQQMNESVTLATGNLHVQEASSSSKIIRPKPVLPIPPPASRMTNLNLNVKSTVNPSSVSLILSSSPPTSSSFSTTSDLSRQSSSRQNSAFKSMSSSSCFSSGDTNSGNIITVA
ncbi:hypothetical protein C5167_036129 [Papaver somniferum]|uniref:transcription factor MYB1R1-like n=1 Tax=Papaver somniferum TaxID=3469 RepID=UPI000E702F66|nr:transcription factor MYB1R1-like [Papaver somniferum]RZC87593.1 hypothetical protein C5167_036129 [Papaver somniferum]